MGALEGWRSLVTAGGRGHQATVRGGNRMRIGCRRRHVYVHVHWGCCCRLHPALATSPPPPPPCDPGARSPSHALACPHHMKSCMHLLPDGCPPAAGGCSGAAAGDTRHLGDRCRGHASQGRCARHLPLWHLSRPERVPVQQPEQALRAWVGGDRLAARPWCCYSAPGSRSILAGSEEGVRRARCTQDNLASSNAAFCVRGE